MTSVAVVITVKDDPRVVPCVQAVLAQEASVSSRVVVVDNGSTDETPQLLAETFDDDPRVELTAAPGNLSAAWNAAAKATDATVLVRIDADTVPEPGWLESLVQPILDDRAEWTAGPVEGVQAETLVERYFHHRTEAYCRRLAADPELRDAVPSWNVAYTRAALERAGWYDPWQASSVDWDLHKRLVRAGATGQYAPGARLRHHHPRTLRALARKEAWYRTGHYQMMLKYGAGAVRESFILPGAYALLLALAAGALAWPPLGLAAAVLLVVYLVQHAVGGRREDDPLWYARPLFRPIEAFAGLYGLLRGLVRYGVRSRPVPGQASAKASKGGGADG